MYRLPITFPHASYTNTSTFFTVAAVPVTCKVVNGGTNVATAITGWSFEFETAFTGPYAPTLRLDSATGPLVAPLGILHSSTAVNLIYPVICPAGHDVYAVVTLTTTTHTCNISLLYYFAS